MQGLNWLSCPGSHLPSEKRRPPRSWSQNCKCLHCRQKAQAWSPPQPSESYPLDKLLLRRVVVIKIYVFIRASTCLKLMDSIEPISFRGKLLSVRILPSWEFWLKSGGDLRSASSDICHQHSIASFHGNSRISYLVQALEADSSPTCALIHVTSRSYG